MKQFGTTYVWLKMAARSLVKNRRRSLFTIGAVAFGFAAVNLFGGFTAYIFEGLEEGYVYAFANGHLSVFKRGFNTGGALRPGDYLLNPEEIRKIDRLARQDSRVYMTSPQLFLSGLISNGKISTIFMAMGRVPSDVKRMRARAKSFIGSLDLFEGTPLSDDSPHGGALSRGLANKLEMGAGDNPVVVAPTIDGQMNALDAEVASLFEAPHDALKDMLMLVPLSFARSLQDTGCADRITVLLESSRKTAAVRRALARRLSEAGLEVEILSWEDLSESYRRIRSMFRVLFGFLFAIVLVIVILSVVNTVSMSVMERTREIGTLRALGLRRKGVAAVFAAESALLGIAGSAAGTAITLAVWGCLKLNQPQWTPPVFATRVPFEVYLVPHQLAGTFLCLILLAMGAAIGPARRAARQSIVDALGHV